MLFLDLTLDSPAENLALDEALLLEAEEAAQPREVLRLWEPRQTFVVLGSSSHYHREANIVACRGDGVPVLRRPSGGAAIVTGPGCLMYSLVLSSERRPQLQAVDLAHDYVLDRLAAGIGQHVPGVRKAGTSDLAIGDRKFSGNSMRCKRRTLLYHGTLLYRFSLEHIARYLSMPPRQPNYRRQRSHGDFVVNLPLDRETLASAVRVAFDADGPLTDWPRERTWRRAAERYRDSGWNERL
jgi:lipoate-protein ligase A